jgi:hypothetical protein
MELWTVDVCTVRPGSDGEFIRLLREHSVGGDAVFLDVDKPRTYWVPRQWASRQQMDDCHQSFSERTAHLLENSASHVMRTVNDHDDR